MDFFDILTLIGGLALFLYGMDVMGDSLKKLAGGKLESFLGKLTSNRIKGFLLGFFVTAVIQSSSATTVMLVGFVNSGIMKLGQTISIIMGANVGTTVTSWLLSLSGLSGDTFWIKIFKPTSFTPILAAIGVVMTMMSGNSKKKDIGAILLGFAVLMFGMDAMSSAMDGLKDSPAFAEVLVMFKNPILGIITGTLLTAIIQSSSASVGILQALAITGTIPYSMAIPIILGQNIGTTITPVISSISGNTDSKRVALSCVYIKMIGVIIVASVFYIINAINPFPFMENNVSAFNIAVVHTLFNIISTIILMPFCNAIEKLAIKSVKGKAQSEDDAFAALDERFLEVPGFAVEKCQELVCRMAQITRTSIEDATAMINNFDPDMVKPIMESESEVDRYEDKLSTYLVKLSARDLTGSDSKMVTELLHVIGDVERMSDHSVNLLEVAQEMNDKGIIFSIDARRDLDVIIKAVCDIIRLTTDSLTNEDLEAAKLVEPLEQVIDRLKHKIKASHIQRLKEGHCTVEYGFILADILTNCERIADHCSNIAVCMLEIAHGSMDTHEYLSHVKYDGENDFSKKYAEYKEKYSL
ncbi:MAG: Na/Pi cotransporter family protein [Clostridia bacterium]|nr:Na/Pi cotransporter family protein [Clostridia bacterium]